jgi:hypothetical protein
LTEKAFASKTSHANLAILDVARSKLRLALRQEQGTGDAETY